jgi:hypothetical protein
MEAEIPDLPKPLELIMSHTHFQVSHSLTFGRTGMSQSRIRTAVSNMPGLPYAQRWPVDFGPVLRSQQSSKSGIFTGAFR